MEWNGMKQDVTNSIYDISPSPSLSPCLSIQESFPPLLILTSHVFSNENIEDSSPLLLFPYPVLLSILSCYAMLRRVVSYNAFPVPVPIPIPI